MAQPEQDAEVVPTTRRSGRRPTVLTSWRESFAPVATDLDYLRDDHLLVEMNEARVEVQITAAVCAKALMIGATALVVGAAVVCVVVLLTALVVQPEPLSRVVWSAGILLFTSLSGVIARVLRRRTRNADVPRMRPVD